MYLWHKRMEINLFEYNIFFKTFGLGGLTAIGKENKREILEILNNHLKDYLLVEERNWIGIKSIKKRIFWDLFFTADDDKVEFYNLEYYKEIFNNNNNNNDSIDYALELDQTNNEYELDVKSGKIRYLRKDHDSIINPVSTYLIRNSVLQFIKNLLYKSENAFRVKNGLSKIGEGGIWKSEGELFNSIKLEFPNENIVQQGTPEWLGKQRFDIYFPERNIAIEYQGIQHYQPVEFFGGEEGFKKTQERDKKREMCKLYDCRLIYVDEGYDRNMLFKTLNDLFVNLQKLKKILR